MPSVCQFASLRNGRESVPPGSVSLPATIECLSIAVFKSPAKGIATFSIAILVFKSSECCGRVFKPAYRGCAMLEEET